MLYTAPKRLTHTVPKRLTLLIHGPKEADSLDAIHGRKG
jgi:hypothetical protein